MLSTSRDFARPSRCTTNVTVADPLNCEQRALVPSNFLLDRLVGLVGDESSVISLPRLIRASRFR